MKKRLFILLLFVLFLSTAWAQSGPAALDEAEKRPW